MGDIFQQPDMLERLIDAGGNVNIRTAKPIKVDTSDPRSFSIFPTYETFPIGSTALKFAQRFDFANIKQILEQSGATE